MKARYRLTTRGIRGSTFYCVDTETGKAQVFKPKIATRPKKSSWPKISQSEILS